MIQKYIIKHAKRAHIHVQNHGHKWLWILSAMFVCILIYPYFSNAQTPVDLCPNIDGIQETIPEGQELDANDNCVDIQYICEDKEAINYGEEGECIYDIVGTPIDGTITYSPITGTYTTGAVTATVGFSITGITITNNNGSNIKIFTENGLFTFTFIDTQGGTGEATAIVTWISPECHRQYVSPNGEVSLYTGEYLAPPSFGSGGKGGQGGLINPPRNEWYLRWTCQPIIENPRCNDDRFKCSNPKDEGDEGKDNDNQGYGGGGYGGGGYGFGSTITESRLSGRRTNGTGNEIGVNIGDKEGIDTPFMHGAGPTKNEPKGKACIYNDEQYVVRGSFSDTLGHRGLPYTEVMRISCLHRGRRTNKGLWIYEPDEPITRAEVLKTVVKILGVAFNDFTINTEDQIFTGTIPFSDILNNDWFAHYANYAYNRGLTDDLLTIDKNGQKVIKPNQFITRYEAIKIIMLAYTMIHEEIITDTGSSVLGDIIDPTNPYYAYIRQAEVLGFISGIPQKNGGYDFVGQKDLTRAEFAKIIAVPFSEQLFYIDEIVINSTIYKTIATVLNRTNRDSKRILENIIMELQKIDTISFLNEFRIDKKTFIEGLIKIIQTQIYKQ